MPAVDDRPPENETESIMGPNFIMTVGFLVLAGLFGLAWLVERWKKR
jgi:hypothetical protein